MISFIKISYRVNYSNEEKYKFIQELNKMKSPAAALSPADGLGTSESGQNV